MALVEIIVANQTGSALPLKDLYAPNAEIPASSQTSLTAYNTIGAIQESSQLYEYIVSDKVLLIVASVPLTKTQSLTFLDAPTYPVKVSLGLSSGAPTATDDKAHGYSVGSIWITTAFITYICIDATANAAVWMSDATKARQGFMPFNDKHWANHAFDSGWAEGGQLTYGTGLQVNVAAGAGFINDATDDNTGISYVAWNATTVTATAGVTSWVYVTSAGTVSISTTEPSFTANVILGTVHANATNISFISNARPANIQQLNGNLGEFFEQVWGGLVTTGLIATQNATPLRLDVTSGVYFLAGRQRNAPAGTGIAWTYWYRNGTGGWSTVRNTSTIDANYYDTGTGTLALIPTGKWKKDIIYVTENGGGTEYHVQYAQAVYNTLNEAKSSPIPAPPLALQRYAARFAGIGVQRGAVTISIIVDERPLMGQNSSTSASSTRVTSRFVPILSSSSMQISVYGRQVVVPVAANGQTNLTIGIPAEATSLVSARLIGIPSAGAAGAARDIDFYTDYGTIGESPTTHQQSDTTTTYNLTGTAGLITVIADIIGLLTSATAGDYVGVNIKHNAIGGQIEYMGVQLTYEVVT